jgi:ketosteroid isomerase-like protein
MSIAIVKNFHSLAAAGRFAEALALFASDATVRFNGPERLPLSGTYSGAEAIAGFFQRIGSLLDVQAFEAQEFIDAGDTVVVTGRERSKVRATGRVFDVAWAQVWRVRDGRLVALTDFFDTGSMAPAFQPDVRLPL